MKRLEQLDLGLLCPHCGKACRFTDTTIRELGFSWHVRCFARFTVEYGTWVAQHVTDPTHDQEDYGDTLGERYGQVVGSDPIGYHSAKNARHA